MYETFPMQRRPVFRIALPVTEDSAYDAVAEYLESLIPSMELVIHQKPESGVWVYYYQSAKYLRTHDISHALLGNAPILVDTTTGEAFATGTAESTETYIAAYIRSRATKESGALTAPDPPKK